MDGRLRLLPSRIGRVVALAVGGLAACAGTPPAANVPPPAAPVLLAGSVDRGRVVYRRACASCHGVRGDGRGASASALDPEPRDFTRGVFRYRSTPSGSLPRDEDLERTVRHGLAGTAMPAWRDVLGSQDVVDVVAYVKHFSPRFGREEVDEPVVVPEPIPYTAESVKKGQLLYRKAQCDKCHGAAGQGDGWAKQDEMKDDLGRVARARDFTRGIYRSGRGKKDLFRVFSTGLDGTPMPAYEQTLPAEDIYHIVNYLLSIERGRGLWHWLTTPPRWYEPSEQQVAK